MILLHFSSSIQGGDYVINTTIAYHAKAFGIHKIRNQKYPAF